MLKAAEFKQRVHGSNPSYLSDRRFLVDWMFDLCELLEVSPVTYSTAVSYMDRSLLKSSVHRNTHFPVATCCLLIAAKFEEQDVFVPALTEMSSLANEMLDAPVLRATEMWVLTEGLGWGIKAATSCHFLDELLAFGCLRETDTLHGNPLSQRVNDDIVAHVEGHARWFLEITIQGEPVLFPRCCALSPPDQTPRLPSPRVPFFVFPNRLGARLLEAVPRGVRHSPNHSAGLNHITGMAKRTGSALRVQRRRPRGVRVSSP